MTVLVKFQIEISFHWNAREFKIVDDIMSTIIWSDENFTTVPQYTGSHWSPGKSIDYSENFKPLHGVST